MQKKVDKRERFKNLVPLVRPYWRYVVGALSLTILLTILGLLPPLIMRALIDRVLTEGTWELLVPLIAAHVLVPVMSGIISFNNTLIISYTGRRLVFDIRTRMYRHLLRLAMRFHGDMSSGAIMSRLMNDVNMVQGLITGNTITIVTDIVSFAFAAVVTFSLNWKMALALWTILPLYVLNYKYFVKRIRRANVRYRRTMDRIAGTLQERISGTRRVRAFGREQDEAENFLEDTRESLRYSMQGTVQSVTFSTASRLTWGIGSTILYLTGVWFALRGEMTYGSVTAFMAYAGQIIAPALRFTELANQFEQVMVSVDRIFEVLDTEPDIKEKPDAEELPRMKGHVEFDNVTFEYVKDQPVIHELTLDIPAGKTVALVGHTGCGKTTLTTLIMRMWDIQQGAIRIDGHDTRDVTLKSLRHQCGVVLQDPVLFNTTVADNLRYGVPEVTMDQVIAAAKAAEIDSMITGLPDGYETELGGSSGIKLSVGEKQRIAIARAIITDPAILIMDEATSSLDSESEALIQKALERVMDNRTSIIVAHRLSTIVEADIIVVMEGGRIIEMGSHSELVRAGGHYSHLYTSQHGALDEALGVATESA
jgi:ABC-type multidrug transport system fused ATPase/permease subunit